MASARFAPTPGKRVSSSAEARLRMTLPSMVSPGRVVGAGSGPGGEADGASGAGAGAGAGAFDAAAAAGGDDRSSGGVGLSQLVPSASTSARGPSGSGRP